MHALWRWNARERHGRYSNAACYCVQRATMLAHARANTNMLHVAALRRYRVNRLFGFSRRRLRVPGKLRASRYQWRSRNSCRLKEDFVIRFWSPSPPDHSWWSPRARVAPKCNNNPRSSRPSTLEHPRYFVNSRDRAYSGLRWILRVIVRWSGPAA